MAISYRACLPACLPAAAAAVHSEFTIHGRISAAACISIMYIVLLYYYNDCHACARAPSLRAPLSRAPLPLRLAIITHTGMALTTRHSVSGCHSVCRPSLEYTLCMTTGSCVFSTLALLPPFTRARHSVCLASPLSRDYDLQPPRVSEKPVSCTTPANLVCYSILLENVTKETRPPLARKSPHRARLRARRR